MNFFLLINVKMPTIVGILTFMNRKNSIISLSEPKKNDEFPGIFILMSILMSCSAELSMKKFYNRGASIPTCSMFVLSQVFSMTYNLF